MNSVNLVGRLTKDPELKFAAGTGTAVSRFTIAVARMKKGEADFINCIAFGKTAETISQYLTKGREIAITGRIQTGSYDVQDGSKRYTTDVAVERFFFIGSGQASNSNNNNSYSNNSFKDEITPVDDGMMPFN